jgi:CRP-like cAMP-binding protein
MTSDNTREEEVHNPAAPSYIDRMARTYDKGAVLFNEGALGREMFVVLKGEVHIHKASGDSTVRLGSFCAGDMFGEMALVEGGVRTGTATIAQDGTKLVAVNQSRFVYLVSQQPAFALSVMGVLVRRVEEMNQRLADLTQQRKVGVTP